MDQKSTRRPIAGRNRIRFAAALMIGTAAGAFAVAPASAQQAGAALRGRITDGGQVTATQVTAINVDSGFRKVSPVSSAGNYNFAALQSGRYRLEVQTPSGVRNTDVFTLSVGQNAQLNFDLSQNAGTATPGANPPANEEPAAGAPPPETASTGGEIVVTGNKIQSLDGGEVGVNVSQHQIETLPQNNRNFLAFADLAPGVQFQGGNGNQSLRGGAQRNSAINVFIDGVSQKDDVLKNGITGQDSSQGNPFPQLSIAEYRVISQNYKAEFDQVGSAAIIAVTKSGTNEFHGDAFVDYTDQNLRAKTPTELFNQSEKVHTEDFQFGGDLGGPIIKDVMHFYLGYEGKRQKNPVDVTPPNGLTPADYPEQYRDIFGGYNNQFNEDLYFGKIDFSPTTSDLFELSGKYRKETGVSFGGGISAPSTAGNIKNNETRGLFHWQHTADAWVNDFKLSYEKSAWNPTPRGSDPFVSFTNDDGQTILQTGSGVNYQNKGQDGWTAQDDFTYTGLVGHTFKAGVKAKWINLNSLQLTPINPHYFYNVDYGDSGFNTTIPYEVQFGVPVENSSGGVVHSKDFQFGVYVQDDWDVTDRLTLNIGIRWDFEHNPSYLDYVTPPEVVSALENWENIQNTDYDYHDYISTGNNRKDVYNEFQPRLGFTYDLTEGGQFQVFGGYGRSYSRDQFDYLALESLSGSYTTLTYYFDNDDPIHPCPEGSDCIDFNSSYLTQEGLDSLATSAGFQRGGLYLINNDLKMPYSDQFSLGTRGQFGRLNAEVGYTHVASRDEFAFFLGQRKPDGGFFVPGSPPDPGKSPGTAQSPFSYHLPGFSGNMSMGTNGIETNSDSAYLKLVKDYSETSPWSMNLTYTFTLAEENRNGLNQYSFDFPSLGDYPFLRSAGIPKHRLVATGSGDLPFGLVVSGKLTLESPPYIYGTALADVPDPYNYPAVPVVTEGHYKRQFIVGKFWARRQIDIALAKEFSLNRIYDGSVIRLRADILNLFNTANYTGYNGNARIPETFGDRSGLSIGSNLPRTVKVSASIEF